MLILSGKPNEKNARIVCEFCNNRNNIMLPISKDMCKCAFCNKNLSHYECFDEQAVKQIGEKMVINRSLVPQCLTDEQLQDPALIKLLENIPGAVVYHKNPYHWTDAEKMEIIKTMRRDFEKEVMDRFDRLEKLLGAS